MVSVVLQNTTQNTIVLYDTENNTIVVLGPGSQSGTLDRALLDPTPAFNLLLGNGSLVVISSSSTPSTPVTATAGIFIAPNGSRYQLTIDDNGNPVTLLLTN